MSTPAQIKAIHAVRRQIAGLVEDEVYREFLENLTGRRSSKELTDAQAWQVLKAMGQLQGGQAGHRRPEPTQADPKAPLVGRILREAYSADWDKPVMAGAFDSSEPARRQRVRDRVLAWLKTHHPHLHGTPKRIEAWPVEALQNLMEHLKGVAGAQRRWKR